MSAWVTIVIIVCAAMLVWLCVQELRRANKARLFWRIAASVIAVICVACMALGLTYRQGSLQAGEIIVTTEGAVQDSIRLFQQKKNPKLEVVDKETILASERVYDSVHVFGYGLNADELEKLSANHMRFYPAQIKTGITAVSWTGKLNKGEPLVLQGNVVNSSGGPVVVQLNAFNTTLDTVMIPAGQTTSFQLKTVPKQNGKALYGVCVVRGKDTLEKEPVAIEVGSSTPLRLLVLSGTPDFENRFLKDWLVQQGYSVAVRTMISTNKFDRASINTGAAVADRITGRVVDSFDIILSDEAAMSHMSASERDAIHNSVMQNGTGLIIRGDTIASTREWYTRPFHLYTANEKNKRLKLSMQNTNYPYLFPADAPRFIREESGMQALVTDSALRAVTAMAAEGTGRLVFTTLDNTYSWLLSGNANHYYDFWSTLLQKAGRKHKATIMATVAPLLPVKNNPVSVRLETMSDTMPEMRVENARISLLQNRQNPFEWQGTTWMNAAGWHTLETGNEKMDWYVYDNSNWRMVTAAENIRTTLQYVNSVQNRRAFSGRQERDYKRPVLLFWFFLPFIICSAFLWAERKIS